LRKSLDYATTCCSDHCISQILLRHCHMKRGISFEIEKLWLTVKNMHILPIPLEIGTYQK
jgi:hypothetical protein